MKYTYWRCLKDNAILRDKDIKGKHLRHDYTELKELSWWEWVIILCKEIT